MSAHSITSRGLAGRKIPQGTLTPIGTLLFAASEQGAWYDPSDIGTLYQDSAGTTPVTAVEQPVGRMLDKSGRGNHATQATTTKRPVLSRRVNLLTKTEDLGASDWVKGAATTSGRKVVEDTSVNNHSVYQLFVQQPGGYTARFKIKSAGRNFAFVQLLVDLAGTAKRYCVIVDLVTGLVTQTANVGLPSGTSCAVQSLGGGVWNVSASINQTVSGSMAVFVGPSNSGTPALLNGAPSYLGDGASGVEAWDAELIVSHQAVLPYQRVNTATDYDADPAKFPAYLRFDGVDDAMVTVGNMDLSGTDKVTVWAGSLNAGTTGYHLFSEFGNFASGDSGTFSHFAALDAVGRVVILSKAGGSEGRMRFPPTPSPPPEIITYALDASKSIPAEAVPIFRKNGLPGSKDFSGTFSTAEGWGNHPLYIGARGGTSLYFNGRLYSLIVRGAQSSLSQIEATELYIKQKMRLP